MRWNATACRWCPAAATWRRTPAPRWRGSRRSHLPLQRRLPAWPTLLVYAAVPRRPSMPALSPRLADCSKTTARTFDFGRTGAEAALTGRGPVKATPGPDESHQSAGSQARRRCRAMVADGGFHAGLGAGPAQSVEPAAYRACPPAGQRLRGRRVHRPCGCNAQCARGAGGFALGRPRSAAVALGRAPGAVVELHSIGVSACSVQVAIDGGPARVGRADARHAGWRRFQGGRTLRSCRCQSRSEASQQVIE